NAQESRAGIICGHIRVWHKKRIFLFKTILNNYLCFHNAKLIIMKKILLLAFTIVLFSCKNEGKKAEKATESKELTVYTHRHYESDQMLFQLFEEKTGIKVDVVNASADELIQKMMMEGA